MTNSANTFYTVSSISTQAVNTKVEYYLLATYWREGTVVTQRYPSACTEDHLSYVVNP